MHDDIFLLHPESEEGPWWFRARARVACRVLGRPGLLSNDWQISPA
jgi:hypothetical protein